MKKTTTVHAHAHFTEMQGESDNLIPLEEIHLVEADSCGGQEKVSAAKKQVAGFDDILLLSGLSTAKEESLVGSPKESPERGTRAGDACQNVESKKKLRRMFSTEGKDPARINGHD